MDILCGIMDGQRKYNETELAEIVKKAAELQREAQSEAGAGPVGESHPALREGGFSLGEIEAAAREAGIDPAFVRDAALSVSQDDAKPSRFLGGPSEVSARSVCRAFSDAELDDVLNALPSLSGTIGYGSARKGRLSWAVDSVRAQSTGASISVSVEPERDASLISVKWDLKLLAGGFFGGIMGGLGLGVGFGVGLGVGMGALHSLAFSLGFIALSLAGSYLLARFAFGRSVREARKRTRQILAGILRAVGSDADSGSGD
jgi:hypothetical protein